MTRLSLIILTCLILMSGLAYAKWERIGDDYAGIVTQYIDLSTIRRNGDLVQMWDLVNFKNIQTRGNISFVSSKGLREYDCPKGRVRVLAVTWLSEQMSTGSVIQSLSNEFIESEHYSSVCRNIPQKGFVTLFGFLPGPSLL
jgi:hypothetical protein